jgi:copper homeostasis protein
VDRVLTSGQEATCLEGIDMIADLNKQSGGRIIVMPGGGLTIRNIPKIVQATSVSEIHLSARTQYESGMKFRNSRCFMGGTLRSPEFSWKVTDENAVRTVCSLARNR